MKKEIISVIVPVYNCEKYVGRCIESIINQTYDKWELILVNDGSEDKSLEIINKYVSEDKRIKLYNKVNGGVSSARNLGLDKASGDYICFVDADDELENETFSKCIDCFKNEKIQIVAFNYIEKYTNEIIKEHNCKAVDGVYKNTQTLEMVNYRQVWSGVWAKVFVREAIGSSRFPLKIKVGEDYSFLVEVLLNVKKIYLLDYKGYIYNQNDTSVVHAGYKGKAFPYICNFKRAFNSQVRYDSKLKESALAFFELEMMAVITAMAKSKKKNAAILNIARGYIVLYLKEYLKNKNVGLFYKGCAVIIKFSPHLFMKVYNILQK